jgi:LPS sulfotransferase NodH
MAVRTDLVRPGHGWRPPDRLLIIGGYYRCGSSYLGSLLRSTERLGRPEEYFNLTHGPLKTFVSGDKIDFPAAFSAICKDATTDNGICSFKLFPTQFEFLLNHCDFAAWFPEIRFIWLQRADLLAQAISLTIARQTGVWHQTSEAPRNSVRYDSAQLSRAIESIANSYRYWARFFAQHGITPKVLTYESLCRQPDEAVREIAEFMDCELPPACRVVSDLRRQQDQADIDLRRAFLGGMTRLASVRRDPERVVPRTVKSVWALMTKRPL